MIRQAQNQPVPRPPTARSRRGGGGEGHRRSQRPHAIDHHVGHRFVATLCGLGVLAIVVASGCGIASDEQATVELRDDVPFDLLGTAPPGTTPTAPPGGSMTTRICLVGADDRIYPVQRALAPGYDPTDLVDALVRGPEPGERTYGLTTALGERETVISVTVEGGVADVELDAAISNRPSFDQLHVVAQLVCTLTEQPGVGQVRFAIDRRPIDVPTGTDGSLASGPVSREDYDTLIASTGT